MLQRYKDEAVKQFGFEDIHTIAIFKIDDMVVRGEISPLESEMIAEHIFDKGMNEGIEVVQI